MNENNQFFIRANRKLVEVSEDVYREYYKIYRRERYLEERDVTHGTVHYSDMDTDDMLGEEAIPDMITKSVEQVVVDEMMSEKLCKYLDLLPNDEYGLIDALFFKEMTEREYAAISDIPQQTINSRKKKILNKLKKCLKIKKVSVNPLTLSA